MIGFSGWSPSQRRERGRGQDQAIFTYGDRRTISLRGEGQVRALRAPSGRRGLKPRLWGCIETGRARLL